MGDVIQERLFEMGDASETAAIAASARPWMNQDTNPQPTQETASLSSGAVSAPQTAAAVCEEEDEAIIDPYLPMESKLPPKILAAADEVANLAAMLGKNSALRDPQRVAAMLWARFCGHTNVSKIADDAGINRVALHRILSRGEGGAPAYVKFLAYWNHFLSVSITMACDVVRQAAHTAGNWQAALKFRETTAPEDFSGESKNGGVNVNGNLNVMVLQKMEEFRQMSNDDLQRYIAQLGNQLNPQVRAGIQQHLRPDMAEELGFDESSD